jgi:hypothetical protein
LGHSAGLLISEPEDGFKQGDPPPAVVAVHLPKALDQPGVQGMGWMFDARGCGDRDGLAVHGKAYVWGRVVFDQWRERTGIAVMRRDEMER